MKSFRALDAIQKRGRWKTMKSVMRYEKAGRMMQEMSRLSKPMQDHLALCAAHLGAYILGKETPPEPPRSR